MVEETGLEPRGVARAMDAVCSGSASTLTRSRARPVLKDVLIQAGIADRLQLWNSELTGWALLADQSISSKSVLRQSDRKGSSAWR
jgi:hypothetical protein